MARPPDFDAAFSGFLYAFPVDRLLKSLKYDGRLSRARLLGELLGRAVKRRRTRPDVLVAVPLHAQRWRERGFNQARELARAVARLTGIPLMDGASRRIRNTPPLWGLPPRQRRRQLRDAFRTDADLRGLSVAVVDDVLTTGVTAAALTRSLRRAGPTRVEIWTVARATSVQAPANV